MMIWFATSACLRESLFLRESPQRACDGPFDMPGQGGVRLCWVEAVSRNLGW